MKVQVKVLQNADEINEAKSKNERYARERQANASRPKTKKVPVPDDIEVPEQIIEPSYLLIDIEDVKSARINEIDMISIFHLYRGEMQIINTPDVWAQLEERFK